MTDQQRIENTHINRRKRRHFETEEGIKSSGSIISYHHYYIVYIKSNNQHIETFTVSKFNSSKDANKAASDLAKRLNDSKDNTSKCTYSVRERHYYQFRLKKPKQCKSFNLKDFANNKENAYKAAVEYERKRLDEFYPRIVPMVSIEHQQLIASFCDGDGCISIVKSECKSRKSGAIRYSYLPAVQFSQSQNNGEPDILKFIQNTYSCGRLYSVPPTLNHRRQWKLAYHGDTCSTLLEHLAAHCILKANQANIAIQCWKDLYNRDFTKCEEYFQAISKLKDEYQEVKINETRITPQWLCSFFDAEGTVGVYKKKNQPGCYFLQLGFAQKSSIAILESIQKYYKNQLETTGSIGKKEGILIYAGKNAAAIIDDLLKATSIVKKQQLQIAKRFYDLTERRDQEAAEERKMIEIDLKQLKRL